jgi:hypothetical protein
MAVDLVPWMIGLGAVAVVGLAGYWGIIKTKKKDTFGGVGALALILTLIIAANHFSVFSTQSAANTGVADNKDVTAGCNGIASALILYNDVNSLVKTTDPSQNMTIYSPALTLVADDASSTKIPVRDSFTALAGNTNGAPATGYFAKDVSFKSVCSDLQYEVALDPASAPTLTLTNDNGVTLNADSAREAVAGSSTYSPTLTIKAPANGCAASDDGAVINVFYDATAHASVTSPDVGQYVGVNLKNKISPENATSDQVAAFFVPGRLCDGQKKTIVFDLETTSADSALGAGDVSFEWYGINKDLDSDSLSRVITGLYDDKSNSISLAPANVTYFTS